jgi:hypothetical protein
VTAADPYGASASQTFHLTVGQDQTPPQVSLDFDANPADINAPVTILVTAIDPVGVTALDLTVGGTHYALDAHGTARVTLQVPGPYTVVATATDAAGLTGTATATLYEIDPTVTAAPVASILGQNLTIVATNGTSATTGLPIFVGLPIAAGATVTSTVEVNDPDTIQKLDLALSSGIRGTSGIRGLCGNGRRVA